MRGIADGAGVSLASIFALNEKGYTERMDAQRFRGEQKEEAGWHKIGDWLVEQKSKLANVTIEQRGKPAIKMITEGG